MVWMLVRDAERSAVQEDVLAACPDSPERGDAWMWTIRRTGDGQYGVEVDTDPDAVIAEQRWLEGADDVRVEHASGEAVAVVPVHGAHTVAVNGGPWTRTLDPGDVFVVEGEEDDHLVVSGAPTGTVCVVHLRPVTDSPLRWVP